MVLAPAPGDRGRDVRFVDDGGEGGDSVAVGARSELEAIVDAVVQVLLEHGAGTVTLRLVEDSSSVRVRVHDESRGLPPAVSTALARRTDNAVQAADVSLAERAARCGARLMQTSSAPTTLDLLLPRE